MNFTQEQNSDILVELANKGGTHLGLSQKTNIRSFLSLPKGDSANSERSEELIL